jgi:hypothetical protein
MLPTAAVSFAIVIAVVVILVHAFACGVMARSSEFHLLHKGIRPPRLKITEAYPGLKTGDVVLFVAHVATPTNTAFSQTFYSHSGVVLAPLGPAGWEAGRVYLSEAQPGHGFMPDLARPGVDVRLQDGSVITPLLTRLKFYMGSAFLMRLARPLARRAAEAVLVEARALYAAAHPYPSAVQAVYSTLGGSADARHCMQHTAHLLDVAGLTSAMAETGFLKTCREVCSLPGRALRDGNFYLPPVQLVYDADC